MNGIEYSDNEFTRVIRKGNLLQMERISSLLKQARNKQYEYLKFSKGWWECEEMIVYLNNDFDRHYKPYA